MEFSLQITGDILKIGEDIKGAQDSGLAGIWSTEARHDPFLPLGIAAHVAPEMQLGTSVAVAFARNPLVTAVTAHEIQRVGGRLRLGLGSQVKAHIVRRYDMPWSKPAARMGEYVRALRAMWEAFNTGERLNFEGEFYSNTLLPEHFRPPASDYGAPAVYLAGVGPLMTETAGEVADGFLTHPFSTAEYLRSVTIPALKRGAQRSGRDISELKIAAPGFVITGTTEEELNSAFTAVAFRIALYASTPGYRGVLALHGLESLQDEAIALLREGKMSALPDLVDRSTAEVFAVIGEPETLVEQVEARYGDLCDFMVVDAPYEYEYNLWQRMMGRMS